MKTLSYLLMLAALTGCLSRKPLTKDTFAFTVPPVTHAPAAANAPVLTLRQISVVPTFDTPSLTYRTGQFSFERDPYAAFLVSPAESLRPPIIALLQNSGKFPTVTDLESSMRGTLSLEISVTQMYGDFANKAAPSAVLEMRFILFDASQERRSRTQPIVFQQTYTRRIPLKANTAKAVVEGLNEALDQIVSQFVNDVPTRTKT
jgi:cholesterol transport system auxiliary component